MYGTRHPLFAPNYVSPLVAATPEKREHKVLKQEAAAMLNAADAKRRCTLLPALGHTLYVIHPAFFRHSIDTMQSRQIQSLKRF